MTPAFVGFIIVALVGAAAEMASAFSGARKNRLDLSVGIALGSASQIALFVAPVLVLLSYVIGPTPMDLQFWPGAVVMMLIASLTASLVTNPTTTSRSAGYFVLPHNYPGPCASGKPLSGVTATVVKVDRLNPSFNLSTWSGGYAPYTLRVDNGVMTVTGNGGNPY